MHLLIVIARHPHPVNAADQRLDLGGGLRALLDLLDVDQEELLARHVARDARALLALDENLDGAVGQAQQLLMLRDLPSERVVRESAAQMLRALATPYSSHYAYRAEWSPAAH